MAEENVAKDMPQDNATVTDPVTDDALSSAWDAAQGDEGQTGVIEAGVSGEIAEDQTEEGKQEDQTPEEPTDNAERSRLGRRMKNLEDSLNQLLSKLDSIPNQANPAQPQSEAPTTVAYDDSFMERELQAAIEQGIIPDTIITPMDQLKVDKFRQRVEEKQSLEYQRGYINALKGLKGNTADTLHDEVVAELFKVESPYNQKRYGDPGVDARLNYLEAKSAILEGKMTTPTSKSVFRGKQGNVPTGNHVSTTVQPSEDAGMKLDEVSLQFIKSQGMSEESVRKALKTPLPLHLKGRF
jgi:hypothetical protein